MLRKFTDIVSLPTVLNKQTRSSSKHKHISISDQTVANRKVYPMDLPLFSASENNKQQDKQDMKTPLVDGLVELIADVRRAASLLFFENTTCYTKKT